MALADGLQRAWHFENNLTDQIVGDVLQPGDFSAGYFESGKIGQAASFDGTIARALGQVSPAEIDLSAGFTLSVWVKTKTVNVAARYAVSLDTPAGTICQIVWQKNFLNNLIFGFYVAGANYATVRTINPAVEAWFHVCVVSTPGAPYAFFVNGAKTTHAWASSYPSGVERLAVGGRWDKSLGVDRPVDLVYLWNRPIFDSEVALVYNAGAGWEYTPADNTPDSFDFVDVVDADLSSVYASDAQQITGMDAGTAISITGGEYRINGGSWTSVAGTINPGDTLELRQTSSPNPETATTATVTVGTLSVGWSVTTAAAISVITTLLGPTLVECRILSSRIVRGIV